MSLSLSRVPEGAQNRRAELTALPPPYTHLPRRSGRSPALPYPPSKQANSITKHNPLI